MESSTNQELPVEWAGPGAILLFLAIIGGVSALLTMILCRRVVARQNTPPYWHGLLGSVITALLATFVCYEDYTGNVVSILEGGAIAFLLFEIPCLIPALFVVRYYRKKTRPLKIMPS